MWCNSNTPSLGLGVIGQHEHFGPRIKKRDFLIDFLKKILYNIYRK